MTAEHPTRSIAAVLAGAIVAGALLLAGAGPAAALGTTAPPPIRICEAGGSALSSKAVRALLRRQGYFSIRALRFHRFEAAAPKAVKQTRPGVFHATASHGFGIVRWRLSIDPCSGRILRSPLPRQPQSS